MHVKPLRLASIYGVMGRFSSDVALETADDLLFGLTLAWAAVHVVSGALVAARMRPQANSVEGPVGVATATAV